MGAMLINNYCKTQIENKDEQEKQQIATTETQQASKIVREIFQVLIEEARNGKRFIPIEKFRSCYQDMGIKQNTNISQTESCIVEFVSHFRIL